jgi:hypothetical protein
MFRGKAIRPLGFSHRGDFIGERAALEGGPGGPTICHRMVSLAPLHLIFDLREASVKIGGLAFVSSNSENISYVAFLKHKTAENMELALWHLVNRLVLENA